jgi:hypothetical protein
MAKRGKGAIVNVSTMVSDYGVSGMSVPLENLQMFEMDGNYTFYPNSPPMLIFLTILLGILSSMFRSRAALELENLALRHQIGVASALRAKTPEIDPSGPPVVGLAVPHVARLAFGTDHRQARNGRGLASCRLSPVLDLEGAAPLGPTNFGIFDAFADESGRQAHLNGPIAKALMARAPELLAKPPAIEPIDVLGAKLPG